jgi:hypothetical protein
MFSSELWGIEMRDVGYLHARAGAAQALCRLGERGRARELAEAELGDLRVFGAPRALGVALRAAGLAQGGSPGLELLEESVVVLRDSPAVLERAHSLTELGAALRRKSRAAARDFLGEALDLAARCGARPLAARAQRGAQDDGRPTPPGMAHGCRGADTERAPHRPARRLCSSSSASSPPRASGRLQKSA